MGVEVAGVADRSAEVDTKTDGLNQAGAGGATADAVSLRSSPASSCKRDEFHHGYLVSTKNVNSWVLFTCMHAV